MCRSEEHTSELQSLTNLVCRLLLEKKKKKHKQQQATNTNTTTQHEDAQHAPTRLSQARIYLDWRRPCLTPLPLSLFFFFFNDTATTEIYTLSLHDALPI